MGAPRRLLGAALCAVALACGGVPAPGPQAPSAGTRLGGILERGALRVGTSADLAPLTLRGDDGEVTGFEVELARALAAAMGLEPRFTVEPFADLLDPLEGGEVDLREAHVGVQEEAASRAASG